MRAHIPMKNVKIDARRSRYRARFRKVCARSYHGERRRVLDVKPSFSQ
jgi:hypothetical protein